MKKKITLYKDYSYYAVHIHVPIKKFKFSSFKPNIGLVLKKIKLIITRLNMKICFL